MSVTVPIISATANWAVRVLPLVGLAPTSQIYPVGIKVADTRWNCRTLFLAVYWRDAVAVWSV